MTLILVLIGIVIVLFIYLEYSEYSKDRLDEKGNPVFPKKKRRN